MQSYSGGTACFRSGLPCELSIVDKVTDQGADLDKTVAELVNEAGFRLELVRPADAPSYVELSRGTVRLTVSSSEVGGGSGPGGMVLPELVPELVVCPLGDDAEWGVGRAGMRYRDLIPSRLGGRFIASHIEVCDGGPIPDLVHYHAIRFQIIVCQRGWVDVVYQDQGPPFRMVAGDMVLQPPGIRHQVLASSAGARVVEIGCPAAHDTLFDYELELPTGRVDPHRDFGGQRFVRHVGAEAEWATADPSMAGFQTQLSAVGAGTGCLAQARFHRVAGAEAGSGSAAATVDALGHQGEFHFVFVMAGQARLSIGTESWAGTEGLAATLPPGTPWRLDSISPDLVLLEVTL